MHDNETAREREQTTDAVQDAGQPIVATLVVGEDPSAWCWSWPVKAGYVLTGVVLPVLCFPVYSRIGANDPSWQSGKLGAYATLLLRLTPSLAFSPLLLYSIVSMILMVRRPESASRRFWVRFGIYMGVALAIHYSVLLPIAMSSGEAGSEAVFFLASAFVAILIWVVAWLALMPAGKSRALDVVRKIAMGLGALAAIAGTAFPLVLIVAPFLFATPWAVIAYGSMSWRLLRRRSGLRWQFSLAQLLGFVL